MPPMPTRLIALITLLLTCMPAGALIITGFSSAEHARFTSGWGSAPVPNSGAGFIGAGLDWSGVGWDTALPSRSVAMINDQYFVYSTHYAPTGSIQFLSPTLLAANPGDPAAALVSFTVDSTTRLTSPISGAPSDFAIGRLSSPIAASLGIAAYPILDLGIITTPSFIPSSLNPYIGLDVLMYGHNGISGTNSPIIGRNTISGFIHYDFSDVNGIDDTLWAAYEYQALLDDEANFQGGDSSGPTFYVYPHGLALVGTHSAVGTISGTPYLLDNFLPGYLGRLSALGITFTTAAPEPSRSLLCLLAGFCLLRRRRVFLPLTP
jgi:hypothetical protein